MIVIIETTTDELKNAEKLSKLLKINLRLFWWRSVEQRV